MSKWLPDGGHCFQREDGRYLINRSPDRGYPAVYMLVKLGKRAGDQWIGSEIIGTARAEDDAHRKQAVESLLGLCDE